jgi:hypothetical protein
MAKDDQGLLRPDLWDLLLPAIKAARQAGRDFAAGNGYVPRQPLVAYQRNDAGWPQVTKDTPGIQGVGKVVCAAWRCDTPVMRKK